MKTAIATATEVATKPAPSKFAKAIVKAKPLTTGVKETKSTTTLKAEELIQIHRSLHAMGAFELMDKADDLKKELAGIIADAGYDKADIVELKTDEGVVTFSACSKKTVVSDKAKMVEHLGDALFAQIAEVGVSDLKKYLGQTALNTCTEQQWGSRSLKSVTPT